MTQPKILTALAAAAMFLTVACHHDAEPEHGSSSESAGDEMEDSAHHAGHAIARTADHAEEETREAIHRPDNENEHHPN